MWRHDHHQMSSQTMLETMPNCFLEQFLSASISTSNTSHCLALKNVLGPIGGPSAGGTMTLILVPTSMRLIASSNPGRRRNEGRNMAAKTIRGT